MVVVAAGRIEGRARVVVGDIEAQLAHMECLRRGERSDLKVDVADDGAIVNLVDMQPLDENSHCSSAPVRFVLEMHQGWFASKGLKAGSQLSGSIFNKKE